MHTQGVLGSDGKRLGDMSVVRIGIVGGRRDKDNEGFNGEKRDICNSHLVGRICWMYVIFLLSSNKERQEKLLDLLQIKKISACFSDEKK